MTTKTAAPTHTPTPWKASKLPGSENWSIDITDANEHIATAWGSEHNAEANATRIVRAVNSHEDLIASIKEAIQSIENGAGIYAAGFLKDAIARAEGRGV